MTLQTGLQTIAILTLANISQSKDNQIMKYKTSFYFLKKLDTRWKQVVRILVLIYFDSPQLALQKSKRYKTLDYWSRDMLNFNFSEKGLRLVSPTHFANNFSRKMSLVLHSIKWSNFMVWLPLLLEILDNMCITVVC